jgi:hypothetical protein
MRFSTLGFFHQSTLPRALIHGLKPFRIWLRNRREIQDNRLKLSASAVSRDRRGHFRGFNETAEAPSAASKKPRVENLVTLSL